MTKRSLSFVLAMALLAAGSPARAQEGNEDDPEVVKMAKEHYKLGLEAYKAGKYDVAIKELKRAYLLKRLPPLLLNIAATYRKLGDNQMSLHFYKKYLDEAPPDAKDREDVQRTIVEITDGKAPDAAPPAAKPAAPPVEPTGDAPAATKEEPAPQEKKVSWNHNVIDAVPPEQPVDVRITMPVMKGVKVYVYYRVPGEADFRPVLMKRRGGEKIGRIPADAVAGSSLQYYIEARDPGGNVVKTIGTEASPNIIMVDPSAAPQMVAGYVDRGGPQEEPHQRAEEPAPESRSDEEEPPRRKKRNLDDEEAPVNRPTPKAKSGGGSSGGPRTLTYVGAALLGVGAAGLAVGIAGNVLAKQYSDALTADSKNPIDKDGNKIFFNDDPNAVTQAAVYQSNGKMWNAVGIAGSVAGGALAITGVALIAVDATRHASGGSSDRPKPRRRPQPVEESWFVAPTASPTYAGVAGGFAF